MGRVGRVGLEPTTEGYAPVPLGPLRALAATLDAVRSIAADLGVTPGQVALSWVANRPGVVAPIIGARTLDQLEQNLVAGDLQLTDEQTARLEQVSAPTSNDYPYGPFGVKQRDRYVHSSDQAIAELF